MDFVLGQVYFLSGKESMETGILWGLELAQKLKVLLSKLESGWVKISSVTCSHMPEHHAEVRRDPRSHTGYTVHRTEPSSVYEPQDRECNPLKSVSPESKTDVCISHHHLRPKKWGQ